MSVVVTGGAGFIGSTLAHLLLDQGFNVLLFDNLASGERGERNLRRLSERGAAVCRGDIRNSQALAQAFAGAEAVVHLAAIASVAVSVADPELCWAINAQGTRNVLEQARLAGVKRVIFASTAAVYGMEPRLPSAETDPLAPASPYADAKIDGENACRAAAEAGELETVVFRFFNVYGPGQDPTSSYSGVITRWVEALRSGNPVLVYGDGSQTRDFVHVADIAAAIVLALKAERAPVGAINIGQGVATSLNELLHHLARACGVEPAAQYLPFREGDVLHSRADISRARELLGFAPSVGLAEGLKSLVG